MLRAENVLKTYDSGRKIALDRFSISVPQGSIYGLLGPNGAGKTSFIRIINQITQADSGEIFIHDEKLNPKHIREIGYMPEERGLYKNMTVGDQILYFGELKGMTRNEALKQAKYWFDALEIEHWWKKKLSELSKGMAQKIQFVVTVLHQPRLLILDEPFSGFDPVNANLIKDQILKLKENGTTIILSTHRMESVEEMCDSVALIHQSKKILDGSVFEVREQFKKNIFGVCLSQVNEDLWQPFQQKFNIENENRQHDLLSFELKNSGNQNALLDELLKIGKIRSFDEKIPSMNEVFISAVSGQ
ncbi:ABC transporter ATP-binding protein [Amniculibacterium sp. G2-70]|uniref:ABC transporter ATP-binding protein n=1 Tax=Amniculibacterium sp. G2-70 TaxID=2767188 RepID=UPI001653EEC5|nr:ATP-binding cassette domain-containing protein [Amniculibacterium sp. G2-70]